MNKLTKFQKWLIGVGTGLLILGLFALGVYIAGLCKDLTWIEMFKEMFGIGGSVLPPEV